MARYTGKAEIFSGLYQKRATKLPDASHRFSRESRGLQRMARSLPWFLIVCLNNRPPELQAAVPGFAEHSYRCNRCRLAGGVLPAGSTGYGVPAYIPKTAPAKAT
jgi:hypothetical protein